MAAFSSPRRILEFGTDCNFLFLLWSSSRFLSNLQGVSLSQAPGHPQSQAHSSWLRLVDMHVFYLLVPTALAACLRFLHKIHNTRLNKERWNATIGICVRKLRVLLSCSSPYSVVSKCSKALFAWASWPSGIAQDVLLNVWNALANHASTLQYRSQHGCGQALVRPVHEEVGRITVIPKRRNTRTTKRMYTDNSNK